MTVVLADGCFDALHVGHVAHLEAARLLGTRLVVGVTRDKFVNKGPRRPIYGELDRLKIVMALRCVDFAFLVDDGIEAIRIAKPDIFVKGDEYRHTLTERAYCLTHGVQMAFVSPRPEVRTSVRDR